jgi:hypothetical protein
MSLKLLIQILIYETTTYSRPLDVSMSLKKILVVGSADQQFWKHVEFVLQIGPCVLQKSTCGPKSMRHNYFTNKPLIFLKK